MKIATLIVLLAVVLVGVFILPQLPYVEPTENVEIKVVNVWHIDSFEGGVGSRFNYLSQTLKQGKASNIYINMYSYSYQQALDKLALGETFDIISFSSGLASEVKHLLSPYGGSCGNISSELLLSGSLNGEVVAVPYMSGVYALFARTSQVGEVPLLDNALTLGKTIKVGKNTIQLNSLVCGMAQFNNPLNCLVKGNCSGSYIHQDFSQYQAYEKFVSGRYATVLLGTQRDIYRLSNRMEQGKIDPLTCQVLGNYTDLVQYVALSSSCDKALCVPLVEKLFTESNQQKLSTIGMLSVTNSHNYTEGSWLFEAQQAVISCEVPSVFTDGVNLEQNRNEAKQWLAK